MALRRQIFALGHPDSDEQRIAIRLGKPRKLRIKGIPDSGFPVELENVSPDTSLVIQTHGLGGRRHMGAGVFIPISAP